MSAVVMRARKARRRLAGSIGGADLGGEEVAGVGPVAARRGALAGLSFLVGCEGVERDLEGLDFAAGAFGLGVALGELAVALLEGFVDPDHAGLEVDVVPFEAGQFAGAQAADEAEDPERFEAVSGGCAQDGFDLGDGEGGGGSLCAGGGFDEVGDVAVDLAAPLGSFERSGEGGVDAGEGGGAHAVCGHVGEHVLDVGAVQSRMR